MNNQSPNIPTQEVVDLKPFKCLVATIGTLPTAFVESMTYYECLAYFVNFLENTVIPAINQDSEAIKELQGLFVELKNYVDNYFDNLDIQEEVDNKLDQMAESGQLSEIITAYLNVKSILAYNTIADMKTASNIVDGSFLRTYGRLSLYDGHGYLYKSRELRNTDVIDDFNIVALADDQLVAELIEEKEIKVYDTVTELKDDSSIHEGERVYCMGYSNKQDNGGGFYNITASDETPNNITFIELQNSLIAELEYTNEITVVDTTNLTASLIEGFLNNGVKIISGSPIPVDGTIHITSDDLVIDGMSFLGEGENSDLMLSIDSKNVRITNCKFSGHTGNYLRLTSDGTVVDSNVFDGTNGSTISPVVLWGATNFVVSNNRFINNDGFNLQTIRSKCGTITGNTFINPHYQGSYTATGGETTLQFNTGGVKPVRSSISVNGTFLASNNFTVSWDATTSIASITLTSPLTAGNNVIFRTYRSLEIININSHTKRVTISGNSLNGSGDSGIVICRDYHEGTLNPSNTNIKDSPIDIVISNNVITDCAFAGIAFTHTARKIIVDGNDIRNFGWATSGIYSSGIYYPHSLYATGNKIMNNMFSNGSTSKSWDEDENGIGINGITVNPNVETDQDLVMEYFNSPSKLKIYGNQAEDLTRLYNFFPSVSTVPQWGIDFEPLALVEQNAKSNTTAAEGDYKQIVASNGGVSVQTDDAGGSVIQIQFNDSGDRYCDASSREANLIGNADVKISFWAKSDSNNEGVARILYISNNVTRVETITLTNSWKQYNLDCLVSEGSKNVVFRFQPTGSARIIQFKDLKYSFAVFK